MARSLSKSKINKLGERLRRTDVPEPDVLRAFALVRSDYGDALAAVVDRLIGLGLQPSPRLKSITTIVEKLKREKTRLSEMQDIAGARIVRDMSLREQDELVGLITGAFPGSRVFDRRQRPSAGYRAVHVVCDLDGVPVEVQVRTKLQHLWAQAFEDFADRVGRGIRYGAPLENPNAEVGGRRATEILSVLQLLSPLLADYELIRAHLDEGPADTDQESARRGRRSLDEMRRAIEDALAGLSSLIAR